MSERFEELKKMGLKNLKGELRAEYLSLKDAEAPAKPEQAPSETITMTKDQLKEFVASEVARLKDEQAPDKAPEGMEEVLRMGRWMKKRDEKKANSVARLRLYREDGFSEPGLIIDWKFLKMIENPETKVRDVAVYRLSVLMDNGETKLIDVPLLEWVQINEFETVEVIKKDIEVQTKIDGVGHKPYTAGGYSFANPAFFGTKSKVGSGEDFEYAVTRQNINCTILRPNGKTLQINANRLNQ